MLSVQFYHNSPDLPFRTQFEIDLDQENKLCQEPSGYGAGNNPIAN